MARRGRAGQLAGGRAARRQQPGRRRGLCHLGEAAGQQRGLIPGIWPPPSIVSATAAEQQLAGSAWGAGLGPDRDRGLPGERDPDGPPRADGDVQPPCPGRRDRREVEHAASRASRPHRSRSSAGRAGPGRRSARNRRRAGSWVRRSGTARGLAACFPPGADEGGHDGGPPRGQHQGLQVHLPQVTVPLGGHAHAYGDGPVAAAGRTAARADRGRLLPRSGAASLPRAVPGRGPVDRA